MLLTKDKINPWESNKLSNKYTKEIKKNLWENIYFLLNNLSKLAGL